MQKQLPGGILRKNCFEKVKLDPNMEAVNCKTKLTNNKFINIVA